MFLGTALPTGLRLPSYVFAILVASVGFLLTLFYWSAWARTAFGSGEWRKRSALRWVLRPSSLLIVAAAGLLFYQVLYVHTWRGGWDDLLIALAFVVRYWENDALKDGDITDRDLDDAKAELVAAEEKEKGESSTTAHEEDEGDDEMPE